MEGRETYSCTINCNIYICIAVHFITREGLIRFFCPDGTMQSLRDVEHGNEVR